MSKKTEVKLTMRAVIKEAVEVESSIEGLREQAKELNGGVSQHLLQVAQGFKGAKSFVSACEVQEAWIKSEEAGKHKVDKLPRCWSQAKSNIKAAFNFKMDLGSYKTEHSMRNDLNDKRKEVTDKTGSKKASEALGDIIEKVADPRISQTIEALVATLMGLEDDEAIDYAVVGMQDLIGEIKSFKALLPEKPVKDDEAPQEVAS